MKSLVLVAVFLTLAVSSQCSNCHWGPSYWCQSQDNAAECGSTQYCQENVWKNSQATVAKVNSPQGLECDLCQEVMKIIADELTKNSTEDQVKNALLSFCNSTGPLQSVCVDFVNQYFDQIWQLLVNDGLDPEKVCEQLGLCSSLKAKGLPHPLKMARVGNPISCPVCEMVAKEIMNMVERNTTETEAEVEIKKVCTYLGGFADECRSLIKDFFPELWEAAVSFIGDPKALCQKINFCTSKVTAVKEVSVRQNPLCDVCNMVVSFLKPFVDSNTTEAEVKASVEKICGLLPGEIGTECSTLVSTYFDLIWELMKAEVDSGEVCKQLGFCNGTALVKSFMAKPRPQSPVGDSACDICEAVVTFIKPFVDNNDTKTEVKGVLDEVCSLLPAVGNECTQLVDENFDMIWNLIQAEVDSGIICKQIGVCNSTKICMKNARSGNDTLCSTCKTVVSYVRSLVDSNITEALAKDAVEDLCKKAGPLAGECKDLIDQYFSMIWMLVRSYADDEALCAEIKLCSSAPKTLVQKAGNGAMCSTCKKVVAYVRTLVDSNITEALAKDAVEDLCKKAGPLAGECKDLIDQYFPMIWMLVRSYADDEALCAEIKLCSSASLTPKTVQIQVQKPEVSKASGVFCMICELVMKELISMLDTNATKQSIEDALDKVCDVLPSSVSDDCNEFVKKYGSEIIDLILSGTGAKAVCTALGLCLFQEEESQVQEMVVIQGEKECEICKAILEAVKTLIAVKGGSAAKALDEVCKAVPSGLQNECTKFIDKYGPQLIELLDKAIDPETICKDIKLCSSSKQQLSMKY